MFQERLKSLRLEKKLTQKDISEKLKISQPTYQQWESGKRNPSGETLQKFAVFFDVSTDYLLGNTDRKQSSKFEQDLEKSLNSFHSFDGKEMSDNDREIIREWLIEHFKDK